jgi:thioredoxin 1
MKGRWLAILLVFWVLPSFAYQVVMKDGKTVQGTRVSETSTMILMKDASGTIVNVKKEEIDQQKTDEANKKPQTDNKKDPTTAPAAVDAKHGTRTYTSEDIARMREKYDLAAGTFGEAYKIDLGPPEPEETSTSTSEMKDFERDVLNARLPVMVDFWAPWCGPCRRIAPTIDAVAKDFSGKILVIRVNVDVEKTIAREYNVEAIPTLIFFKDGEPADQLVGGVPKKLIVEKIQTMLKNPADSISGEAMDATSLVEGGERNSTNSDRGESYWRNRKKRLEGEIANIEAEISALKAEIADCQTTSPLPGHFVTNQYETLQKVLNKTRGINSLESRLQSLRQQLEDLPEEARKAGALPGWVRD